MFEEIRNHNRAVALQISKAFGVDIEKARSGIYADTAENRKLHRVGQPYGGKKQAEPSTTDKPKGKEDEANNKPKITKEEKVKDERFSEDGIVGKDGMPNKNSESYKRWSGLREKVEAGQATPEEKKEFARLHNQFLNERDRHNYEQQKKSDPNAKEPQYKTAEERHEEYKKKKEGGKKEGKNQLSPELKKKVDEAMKAPFMNSIKDVVSNLWYDFDHDKKLSDIEKKYGKDSEDVTKYKQDKAISVLSEHSEEIADACDRYGKDVVEACLSSKGEDDDEDSENPVTPEVAKVAVSKCLEKEKKEKEKRESETAKRGKKNAISDFENGAMGKELEDLMDKNSHYASSMLLKYGCKTYSDFLNYIDDYDGDDIDELYEMQYKIGRKILRSAPTDEFENY